MFTATCNHEEIREDRKIYLEHYKNNNQPPESEVTMFFFHGSMASLNQFRDLIDFFKKRVNVVAYDALGCGESDKPVDPWFGESNYSVDNLLLDAVEVFKKYSTTYNILIGHSFGTTIVARVIDYFKKKSNFPSDRCYINGYILLGTADTLSIGRPIFYLPVWVLELIHPILSKKFSNRAFSPNASVSAKSKAMMSSGKNKMHVVKSFYTNSYWSTHDVWMTLTDKPVLIVQGIDDRITPIMKAKKLFETHYSSNPQSKFISLENVGHQLMQENPEQVINAIFEFINANLGLQIN
jgi:abhydrolase domain-containing protein 8